MDIRDHFEALVENTLNDLQLERGLKAALKPVLQDMPADLRMTLATEMAYLVHDKLCMDPRTPAGHQPSIERVMRYVCARFDVADWHTRYEAIQAELEAMLDADDETLLDEEDPL